MLKVLAAGAGGFLGSSARYAVGQAAVRIVPPDRFPLGTTTVNLLGCLLIGVLGGLAEARGMTQGLRVFLFAGVLGGFTTYSALAYESVAYAKDGRLLVAGAAVGLQLLVGFGAVALGIWLGRAF